VKGFCHIPMEARERGRRRIADGRLWHRFTKEELVKGGQATAGKTMTKRKQVNGGKASAHIRSHIRFATYRRDCIYCTELISS